MLGSHWKIYDLKRKSDTLIKKKLPFKITEARVLQYKKGKVFVQTSYFGPKIEVECKKKGVSDMRSMDTADEIAYFNHVSQKKSKDVKKLLQYFDATSQEAVKFYEEVFHDCNARDEDNNGAVFEDEAIH